MPLPVTILKPRLSSTSSVRVAWCARPEMISASFGSATRHMALKRMTATMKTMTDCAGDDDEMQFI